MQLAQLLKIRPGVTAVIGGGGKTSLLRALGEELSCRHTVLLCTTTKIYPFDGIPCARTAQELETLLPGHRLLCMGTPLPESGKLTAPETPIRELAARFDYVLVEADGAAGHPLKAHAAHEPVIPPEADQTVCVVGASGFHQPIAQSCHRPELYARLAGCSPEEEATPETQAAVLKAERLADQIYVNQVEELPELLDAKLLALLADCPVTAGSLLRKEFFPCS